MSLPSDAQTWTTRSRGGWPEGPWDDEPDKISWTDRATNRPCLIVRNGSGGLCGYVAVDPDHPLYKVEYNHGWHRDAEGDETVTLVESLTAHGGLTYSGLCQETDEPSHGICHIPKPGEPDDVWWFGFDCLHGGDDYPMSVARDWSRTDDVYRDVPYVVDQCERLAAQLAAMPS